MELNGIHCIITKCEICENEITTPVDTDLFGVHINNAPIFCEECRKRIKRALYPPELYIEIKPPKGEQDGT